MPRHTAAEREKRRKEEEQRRQQSIPRKEPTGGGGGGGGQPITPPKEVPGSGFVIDGVEVSARDFNRFKDRFPRSPTQQEVKAKQLEEDVGARRAEEEERRKGVEEGEKFFDVQRDIVEPFKAGLPQSPGQLALDVATVTGISAAGRFVGGAGGKGLSLGKNSITKSKSRLASLAKSGDGFKIFGLNIGIKEMIFGGAIYSQRRVGNFVSDMNTRATTLGTEKNEKIAREMISGLDPDTAIRIYEDDIAVLRDSEQTLQLLKIFFIADYIGLKVENTQINIRNQIDGKLSRIAESERFKEGLNIQDIQANLNAEEAIKNES